MRWLPVAMACAAAGCAASPDKPSRAEAPWVLTGARIYVSPDAPPIEDGVVLVQGGQIVTVAPAANVRLRGDLRISKCGGGIVTAGFQNSHVHFTQPVWADAATRPAGDLAESLEAMVTRYGFTTVVDTTSELANTAALRERIEKGELPGPRILTAGAALYPPDGIPFYIRDLPEAFLAQLPQPAEPRAAVEAVRRNLDAGADATKLFVATPQAGGTVRRMPAAIARAAAVETHERGALVMAHPTDIDGLRDAVAAGADILVHTTIDPPKITWDAGIVRSLIENGVGVVPTLKLWPYELAKTTLPPHVRELALGDAIDELRAFASAGGQVLFGTDVGYMTDYDPTDEYVYMARAGLTPMQVLASLTTAPAARWKEADSRGRIESGMQADLVVLGGDPSEDVRHFATVRCTIRAGEEIFTQAGD